MLNPNKRFAKSDGVDTPLLYVYLAGRIAGNCIDKCLEWRQQIVKYYVNYKGEGVYPIVFLDALNSKESDNIDNLGLTSVIPPNLIYDKDLLSVIKADVIVANMEDFMEEGIEDLLSLNEGITIEGKEYTGKGNDYEEVTIDFKAAFYKLQDTIKNRRPNYGTNSEVAWALYLKKPLILIANTEQRKTILEKHPFMKRASVIVKDVNELLENKWLNIVYKAISSALY